MPAGEGARVVFVGLFWGCVCLVAAEYLLYHLALLLVHRRKLDAAPPADWPALTVLVPAHNEAATIADKVRNILDADYPQDKLRIIVADDASDDGTADIVSQAAFPNAEVRRFEERRGKIAMQRDVLQTVDSPIVVLTDATVRMAPDTLKRLVAHFGDPHVGGVSARIHVANTRNNWLVELHRLLFALQNGQKAGESRLDSAGGLYGQLCAVRRAALGDVPADVVYEDREFGIRLRRRGHRVLVDDVARADYLVPDTLADFRAQKARIAGAMTQSIARHARLLFNPAFGWYGLVIFPEYALFRVLRQPLLALAALSWLAAALTGPTLVAALHAASAAAVLLVSFWGASLCLLPYLADRRSFVRRLVTALPGVALLAGVLAAGSVQYLWRGQTSAWRQIRRDSSHATDTRQP